MLKISLEKVQEVGRNEMWHIGGGGGETLTFCQKIAQNSKNWLDYCILKLRVGKENLTYHLKKLIFFGFSVKIGFLTGFTFSQIVPHN